MYASMLSGEGKSSIKAIVAQCLASILRWETVVIPDGTAKDKMFDLELYQYRQDNEKTKHLRERIINDHYLKYLVDAIKYATKSL
jgi:putative ATP-dependent endonuclease of OLD family